MDSLKLPFLFDTSVIEKEIAQFSKSDYYDIYNPSVALETLWSKHLIEPIGSPSDIPCFLPNEALKKCPYLLSILNTFQCEKETFRIHILDPGASIKPHRDIGYRFEDGKIRIHIPVQTNEKVQLLLNNSLVKMEMGECWYCNFHVKHEVNNNSNVPRVHLIMDCIVNDWFEEIFNAATS